MRAWEEYLKALENELGKETVDKWLRSLKVINFDAANLYLEAGDTFQAQWFEEYAKPALALLFRNENNRPIKVHLQVANKTSLAKVNPENRAQGSPVLFTKDTIEPQHTFDHFVELPQNKIALKLFTDFEKYSKDKAPLYNPIYIFGPDGIGKTHLLQATTHALLRQNIRVLYVKLSTFTQNMVMAIKAGCMPDFRKFYRDNDVLIIDEIHHLANKSATQEEFFHTFNTLHIEGKQIILSACVSPQQLEQIEPRLTSRFEWGIVLPLICPTEQQLKKILNKKLEELKLFLPQPSKDFLVSTFHQNPKVLNRALSSLLLRAHLKLPQGKSIDPKKLTPTVIEQLLNDLIKANAQAAITVETILDATAGYYGIKMEDILSKSQSRECVLPRQIGMYFCRHHLKLPFMKIGQIFSRDHSTVMTSVKQIENTLKDSNHDSCKEIHALEQQIFSSKRVKVS